MFNIPVIILKKIVLLPNQEIKLELSNELSAKTIKEANLNYNGKLLIISPIDTKEEEPSVEDLPKVGVLAKIKSKILINSSIQVKIKGIKRVAVNRYFNDVENILYSEVMNIEIPSLIKEEENAIIKKLIENLKKYIDLAHYASNDILNFLNKESNLDIITDTIVSYLPFDINKKLEYMQNINPLKRAKALLADINEEIKLLEIDEELDDKVNRSFSIDQKNYILKEKIKVIKKELGDISLQEETTIR